MNKIECKACGKSIDEDSCFCKYCGATVSNAKANVHNEDKMASIFQRVYKTLYTHSEYSEKEFDEKFSSFKDYENRIMSDDDYYRLLVDIIFYSGFRAATVDKYLERIHMHFPNYQVVSSYSLAEIEKIKTDTNMIQNKSKIDACVQNAKKVIEISDKYGSIKNYIETFNPNSSDEALFSLKRSLEKNFSFLGGTTSYHFMTDIGLNVLKPDRVILRIFKRLGLIESEQDLLGAVKIGRAFSKATNLPIRFIDIIFVLYGQLNQEKLECICSEKNPKGNKCGVNLDCLYAKG
jgi:3-methyladenine DNA glycosylase